jgi:Arc/MetJ-type ribon-helix-helix transcriptional regulator
MEQELTEGTGPFADRDAAFREALKSLLRAAPEDRPDRVETFFESPWIGWAKKKKGRRSSRTKDDMMQRLLKE